MRNGLVATCTVSMQVTGEGEAGARLFARCFGKRRAGSLSHVFNGKWCYGNTWIINSLTPKGISHGGPTPEHLPLHPEWHNRLDAIGQAVMCAENAQNPRTPPNLNNQNQTFPVWVLVLRVCSAPGLLGRPQGRGKETKAGEHRAPLGCSQLVSLQGVGTPHPS